jgi:hypothetical protein
MANIEKRHINASNLSGESYFTSILQEASDCGLLNNSDIENIQLQCLKFLAYKSERYSRGESSSIRVEAAENILKSILYTIGLYLKSLPDADCAVSELKTVMISEMYQKGRALINVKLQSATHFYKMVKANKIITRNYTYNATLDNEGIGSFFRLYNPDFAAHETPASIDYQLCNPVIDLAGIEFIQNFLENLYLENQFCSYFGPEKIHHLLCGYDEGYQDLLINIFEQVFIAALGCTLTNRCISNLAVFEEDRHLLYSELLRQTNTSLALKIGEAAGKVLQELNITNLSLQRYIEKSLPKFIVNIGHAIKTNTLSKTFVSPSNPELKPKIRFLSSVKMADEDYRKLVDELLICRYSSDKLALIKEKVKSFGDMEDLLFDASLSEQERSAVLSILGDFEIAALIKRHPYKSDFQVEDLSEAEQALRLSLKRYIDQLPSDKKEQIFEIMSRLIDSDTK